MHRRQCLGLGLGAACAPWQAWALEGPAPPEVLATWPQARSSGHGRLRFMGLRVYDARLWRVGTDVMALDDWGNQPLALEIQYLRALEGKQVAERSLDEMRRQGDISPDTAQAWLAQMVKLFPNVKNGDRLTGFHLPGEGARFYLNGQRRGEVRDAEFSRRFFGIWLAPQSSEGKLRAALLGQSKP
jgi:hypothetical protein